MKKNGFVQPAWIDTFLSNYIVATFPDSTSQVELAIALSAENIKQKTGGPFGAAVFDQNGQLVAVGVNTVVSSKSSILHAEISAIIQTQEKYDTFDLSDFNLTLASSAQPCIMCFGAIMWSGIKLIKYGASKKDVEAIGGFDEGPQINQEAELAKRGILIKGPFLSEKAVAVLAEYVANDNVIYNPNNKKES